MNKETKDNFILCIVPTGLFIMGALAIATIVTIKYNPVIGGLFFMIYIGLTLIVYPFTKITKVVIKKNK